MVSCGKHERRKMNGKDGEGLKEGDRRGEDGEGGSKEQFA